MCYMTLLSTTADIDLSLGNNDLVRFSRELPGIPEETYLGFKNKWFIGSKSGCSCEFRHLYVKSVELGFGLPEDWMPEEQSDIEATHQIIASIRSLVESGANVDCVDAWSQDQTVAAPLAGEVEVDLATVSNEAFRFFEMHKFVFSSTQHSQPPA
jgi:hypothetical protein